MITRPASSRQPARVPWTRERLVRERSIALGAAIERSTAASYSSALQSYLSFCKAHNFPIEPTPDSFSFHTVYMSHHIKPRSVESYLSGICNQLEPHFPQTCSVRKDILVTRTLTGCKKLFTSPIHRKRPLARSEIASLQPQYAASQNHDDLLFFAMLTTGFGGLLRLGELVWPDKTDLRDYRKVTLRHTVHWLPRGFDFTLPGHKADRLFEGSCVVIAGTAPHLIQAIGRWTSEAFQGYIRKHPVLLAALIYSGFRIA
ncbi:hypothetical protein BOTBODRAFT_109180 [Botryobasidium botryosum FD-172 SS1]|uniref:Core-binding (CB) domain-containing protein n=1 Tax=Botryobasidium botryosum (strain FD-172 SS1) TaxID=930990 RepID=A0A067MJY5_BOTB1|nr:hypothetical protein BOTBODRAFT_109180 [Botryobasidium botryosum FD-172 SS1]